MQRISPTPKRPRGKNSTLAPPRRRQFLSPLLFSPLHGNSHAESERGVNRFFRLCPPPPSLRPKRIASDKFLLSPARLCLPPTSARGPALEGIGRGLDFARNTNRQPGYHVVISVRLDMDCLPFFNPKVFCWVHQRQL